MKKILGLLVAFLMLPIAVNATTIEEQMEKKEYTLRSIAPSSLEEFYFIGELVGIDNNTDTDWWNIDYESCNETFTQCDFYNTYVDGMSEYGYPNYVNKKYEDINIIYTYDEDVKVVVDNLMSELPERPELKLTDIEYIAYLHQLYIEDQNENWTNFNMATFSSELRKLIGYKNFVVEPRLGDGGPYYSLIGGNATFTYNNTIYGIADFISVEGRQIIYLDNDVEDVKKAIEDKLSKYFDITKVEKYKTKDEVIDEFRQEQLEYFNEYIAPYLNDQHSWAYNTYKDKTAEEYAEEFVEIYFTADDAPMKIIDDCENDVYKVTFADDYEVNLFVMLDDDVKDEPTFESIDLTSDVTIKTDGLIPLDTLIQVARLIDGATYNKIVKLLNKENVAMFDLKLFSKTADDYITKLEDGTFEVRLPISEEFKGKDLVVYYVDENDEVKEYEVTIDGDYAVFNTDHFSIYTLAEADKKEVTPEPQEEIKEEIKEETPAKEETKEETPAKEETKEVTPNEEEVTPVKEETKNTSTVDNKGTTTVNPNTSDNLIIYIVMFIISISGIGTLILKKVN